MYRLPNLSKRIREVIDRYGGGVFPKLNWTAPRVRHPLLHPSRCEYQADHSSELGRRVPPPPDEPWPTPLLIPTRRLPPPQIIRLSHSLDRPSARLRRRERRGAHTVQRGDEARTGFEAVREHQPVPRVPVFRPARYAHRCVEFLGCVALSRLTLALSGVGQGLQLLPPLPGWERDGESVRDDQVVLGGRDKG